MITPTAWSSPFGSNKNYGGWLKGLGAAAAADSETANPASVNCIEQGGQEVGEDCVFPDGTRCNSWALLRGECARVEIVEPVKRWDAKGDLIAGGVGFALPVAYGYLAPKTWPQLALWQQALMVVGGYFVTSWIYTKV